ncbi:LytTR family DNA-binding domain-containing protein [Riemerella anatipestifer]|nr:LytTR family DNA-binding domain-containing protein [Riemerella anatipestifer]MDY3358431.1 LytTR family DNA-binding domain-containing protein [Riemerella anatipestifer]
MDEKISCLVLDDEPLGRTIIENFVKQVPFLELSASFDDALEAITFLQKNQVEIIFSDIEMPRINGIELINLLDNPPIIIFITAHRDFALESFNTGAVDYLVKPVRFERFLKAVTRARNYITKKHLKEEEPKEKQDRIFIKTEGKLVKILYDEIIYIEAQGDYLKIVTKAGSYTTLATLKSMENALVKTKLIKVQRSFIINTSFVRAINGNMIELDNGKSISISVNKKEELFRFLGLKQ